MSLMANVSSAKGRGALGGRVEEGGSNSKYSMKAPLCFLPPLEARRQKKKPATPRPTRTPKSLSPGIVARMQVTTKRRAQECPFDFGIMPSGITFLTPDSQTSTIIERVAAELDGIHTHPSYDLQTTIRDRAIAPPAREHYRKRWNH